MSIRVTALILLVGFLSIYAWRSWFFSLCGAILLAAVVQHPDYPHNIGGVQGADPWNFLLLSILVAWVIRRREEGAVWDLPPRVGWMLVGALLVVTIGVLRLINAAPPGFPPSYVVSEMFINCVKWVLPGLLLFDACRTRKQVTIGLAVVLGLYFLLAVQVVKWMPLSNALAGGADMTKRAAKIIQNEIGFNRVTLSMMLAGGSWAILSAVPLGRTKLYQIGILGAAGIVALGQALTAGRAGYFAWGLAGLALCTLRWRKLLPFIPLGVLAVGIALPGVRDRVLFGFGRTEGHIVVESSAYHQTSGRNIAWPLVIEKIGEGPFFGYGRKGMATTGLRDILLDEYGESFPHPHQAYLQQLLDNGLVGFALVMPIFFYALWKSGQLAVVRSDALVCAVGCAAFSLILALMIGSLGGQTFYPREGAVGMWAAIGLMLRVGLQWNNALETGAPLFEDDEPELARSGQGLDMPAWEL